MKAVSIYSALLEQKKLKQQFIRDLENLLKVSAKFKFDTKFEIIRYRDLANWDIRRLGKELSEEDEALIDKIEYMLLIKHNDFASVIRMLWNFRKGVKSGLKVRNPEQNYKWTSKDGNEKHSTSNLPRAHFRWNYGKRYVLSPRSVKKITEFVDQILEL